MPESRRKIKRIFLIINHRITLPLPWRKDQLLVSLVVPFSLFSSR